MSEDKKKLQFIDEAGGKEMTRQFLMLTGNILSLLETLQEKVASMPSCVVMEGKASGKLGQPGPISIYFKGHPDFDLDKVVAGEQQVLVYLKDDANHEVTVQLDVLRTKQSGASVYNVGFSIGIYSYMQMSGVSSTNDLLSSKTYQCCLAISASDNTKLTDLPAITNAMKTDKKIYAIVNGNYEEVAPEGYDLLYRSQAAAATLEADGSLEIPFEVRDAVESELSKDVEPSNPVES